MRDLGTSLHPSSNGRTTAFQAENVGSSPGPDAPFQTTVLGGGACLLSRMRSVRSRGLEPFRGEVLRQH